MVKHLVFVLLISSTTIMGHENRTPSSSKRPSLLKRIFRSGKRSLSRLSSVSTPTVNILPSDNESQTAQQSNSLPSTLRQRPQAGAQPRLSMSNLRIRDVQDQSLAHPPSEVESATPDHHNRAPAQTPAGSDSVPGDINLPQRTKSPGFMSRESHLKKFRAKEPSNSEAQVPVLHPSSKTKENALSVWHGFKLLSKNTEKFLEGTPFKIPVGIINTIITVADTVIQNQESIAIHFLPISQRLKIVLEVLTAKQQHLNGITPTCERFSVALKDAVTTLDQMHSQRLPKRILEVDERPQQIKDICVIIDEATKNFQLELALASIRQGDKITEHVEIARLSSLRPSKEFTYVEVARDSCIKGTREEVIKSILTWCKDTSPESSPIYWLSGMAGTGKSTIAYTICQILYGDGNTDAARCLGASFFCSRQLDAGRLRKNIIPTIVHDLALSLPAFGRKLLDLKFDAQLPPLKDHLRKLLIDPWCASIGTGETRSLPPLVVVVDAVDELQDAEGSVFLEDLIKEVELYKDSFRGLKFLITSRQDPDIVDVATSIPHEAIYRLETVDTTVLEDDITLYLRTKLPTLDESKLRIITKQASGLFIYAATVVRFIIPRSGPRAKIDMARLNQLISQKAWPPYSDNLVLDRFYENIILEWTQSVSMSSDRKIAFAVLQTIICAQEPVLVSDIPQLLGYPTLEVEKVKDFVLDLHAVLYVLDGYIYLFHKSFVDFLSDRTRFENTSLAEEISPTPERHFHLTSSCFRIMGSLRFNICGLPSSYRNDSDVADLPARINENISSTLRYACRHWSEHMSKSITIDQKARQQLKEMFQSWLGQRSLFWLEMMNLVSVIGECYPSLVAARQWLGKDVTPEEMEDLIAIENLATTFGGNITAKSTPHLYLSILAASSSKSRVIRRWLNKFPGIPKITVVLNRAHPLLAFQHDSEVKSVHFSGSGKLIVSGSYDTSVRIWDASTGTQLRQLNGHSGPVTSVCFSLDGTRIASGSWDKTVRIWDASKGNQQLKLEGHDGRLQSVCFSPDGTLVASGSEDTTVRIWETWTGIQLHKLNGHDKYVQAVCFSPDGIYLVSGSEDRTMCMWETSTGILLRRLRGHDYHVLSACFSPDGAYVASGSGDSTIRIWNASTGVQLHKLVGHKQHGYVYSVCFSPGGTYLASGASDYTVRIWSVSTGVQLRTLEGHKNFVCSVSFSPDGTRIVSGSSDEIAHIWDVSTEMQLYKLEGHDRHVRSVCFSPDGTRIASGSDDGTVRIWDTATGIQLHKLAGHNGYVMSVHFSPDGKWVLSSTSDEIVRIWDATTGIQLRKLEGRGSFVQSVCFSMDGKLVASASSDKTVRIWHTSTGTRLHWLNGHTGYAMCVSFSLDGSHIVSGSEDMTVRIWSVSAGIQLHKLEGHRAHVIAVCFSPDGTRIASAGNDHLCTLHIWDASTGALLHKMEGHRNQVKSVCFSPDGKHLISGSFDKTVGIWDALTGILVKQIVGHYDAVLCARISPDGTDMVSGSDDSTMRIWNLYMSGTQATPTKPLYCAAQTRWIFRDSDLASTWRTDWCICPDGWISSSDGKQYLWMNSEMHKYLERPNCRVLSSQGRVDVDFSPGFFGTEWMKCYTSLE